MTSNPLAAVIYWIGELKPISNPWTMSQMAGVRPRPSVHSYRFLATTANSLLSESNGEPATSE